MPCVVDAKVKILSPCPEGAQPREGRSRKMNFHVTGRKRRKRCRAWGSRDRPHRGEDSCAGLGGRAFVVIGEPYRQESALPRLLKVTTLSYRGRGTSHPEPPLHTSGQVQFVETRILLPFLVFCA
jgi:hypothetical protein